MAMKPLFLRRRLVTAAVVTLLSGGVALAAALPAEAHVRVHADSQTAGSFSMLTFRVPNESDTAGTVKLTVRLPTDTPFLYVSTKPVPGWKATMIEGGLPAPVDVDGTTVTKAVRTVTWTADKGVEIGSGEFQEFSISVGPLPQPTSILLPATQTYSDGKVVNWDQKTPASGEEPEHPAPELIVVAAAPDGGQAGQVSTSATPATADSSVPGQTQTATSGADTAARVMGGLGLVLGAAGLVVALIAVRRKGSV